MWNIVLKILFTALVLYGLKHYRFFYILSKTFKRDLRLCIKLFRAVRIGKEILDKNETIYQSFTAVAKKYPQKTAFLFEDESWTFSEIRDLSNEVAVYFDKQGFKKGDTIALLLNNCPEYNCMWLGLSRLGITTALINTNLVSDSLLHCLKIVNSKAIIFGSNFCDVVTDTIMPHLNIKCYQYNRKKECSAVAPNCADLRIELESLHLAEDLPIECKNESLMYIYTSGTTGLPKAAVLNHARYNLFRCFLTMMLSNPEEAITYSPMPMYHASGSVMGCGQAILCGATVVISTKFSASNYWKDCARYKCNVAQYVGEMCRYVLLAGGDENIKHPVEIMFGNGLKPHIWKKFVEKFHVKHIYEFYSATEGNFSLINVDNKIGSIGCIPPYLQKIMPVKLVKYSEETAAPIRDENGLCIKCGVNEPGLAIAIQGSGNSAAGNFVGYVNDDETKKKLLSNVFRIGDRYVNSGDVFSVDEFGYYYFIDRIGDTFRWKGENVSTTEVEGVVSCTLGLNDVVAYGVQVPGSEGRAGMVAIDHDHNTLDVDALLQTLKKNLPSYAIPIFIRCVESVQMTGTFKLQKVTLRSEGFDINVVKDVIYFHNVMIGKYVLLTKEVYGSILCGNMRL